MPAQQRRTWEASDTVLLAQRLAGAVGVDLCNDDFVLGMCVGIGEFLVDWSEVLVVRSATRPEYGYVGSYLAMTTADSN